MSVPIVLLNKRKQKVTEEGEDHFLTNGPGDYFGQTIFFGVTKRPTSTFNLTPENYLYRFVAST